MKKYFLVMMILILNINNFAFSKQNDSIKVYLSQFEDFIRNEIANSATTGRFQLQSFNIDRTHWHYMLDTSTGKLYRMELGRTPDRSEWKLMSNGIIEEKEEVSNKDN